MRAGTIHIACSTTLSLKAALNNLFFPTLGSAMLLMLHVYAVGVSRILFEGGYYFQSARGLVQILFKGIQRAGTIQGNMVYYPYRGNKESEILHVLI